MRTVVYSRLRDGQAVDEVMQEVALAAVRQAAPLQDAAKVAAEGALLRVALVVIGEVADSGDDVNVGDTPRGEDDGDETEGDTEAI